jgi:hypothetical protein
VRDVYVRRDRVVHRVHRSHGVALEFVVAARVEVGDDALLGRERLPRRTLHDLDPGVLVVLEALGVEALALQVFEELARLLTHLVLCGRLLGGAVDRARVDVPEGVEHALARHRVVAVDELRREPAELEAVLRLDVEELLQRLRRAVREGLAAGRERLVDLLDAAVQVLLELGVLFVQRAAPGLDLEAVLEAVGLGVAEGRQVVRARRQDRSDEIVLDGDALQQGVREEPLLHLVDGGVVAVLGRVLLERQPLDLLLSVAQGAEDGLHQRRRARAAPTPPACAVGRWACCSDPPGTA